MVTTYLPKDTPVSQIDVESRAKFISRTYIHLFAAIIAFTGIEIAMFKTGLAHQITEFAFSVSWLVILGGFMLVSWGASHVASRAMSLPVQYLALGGFVLAYAIMFAPLLVLAYLKEPSIINSAAQVTLFGFAALSVVAFWTRKDFSFLRGVLMWGGIVALIMIVASVIFGFELGTFFSVAMIAFAGAAILYDTSNIIHHFPEDRYVSAAMQLFASVGLMFWYVLRLFMGRD